MIELIVAAPYLIVRMTADDGQVVESKLDKAQATAFLLMCSDAAELLFEDSETVVN